MILPTLRDCYGLTVQTILQRKFLLTSGDGMVLNGFRKHRPILGIVGQVPRNLKFPTREFLVMLLATLWQRVLDECLTIRGSEPRVKQGVVLRMNLTNPSIYYGCDTE